jgi:hypothetical protein
LLYCWAAIQIEEISDRGLPRSLHQGGPIMRALDEQLGNFDVTNLRTFS